MYDFDLGLSSGKRWKSIIEDKRDLIEEIKPYIDEMSKPFEGQSKIIETAINGFDLFGGIEYSGEIKTLAKAFNIPFWKAVLMQLCYESNSCCTAVVDKIGDKHVMFRVMESKLTFLKKATIDLRVIKNGNVICYATTWLGYMGFLTACKPSMCAIAVNYRGLPDFNLQEFIKKENNSLAKRRQVGYALRYAMESYRNIDDTIRYLKNHKLITQCYFVICRCNDIPLTIIREEYKHYFHTSDKMCITNTDPTKNEPDVLNSLVRRQVCQDLLEKTYNSADEFIKAFSNDILISQYAIYYNYISPQDGNYKTFLIT